MRVERGPAAVERPGGGVGARTFRSEPVLRLGHERAELAEHGRGRRTGDVQRLDPVESREYTARFVHVFDRSPGGVTSL